MPHHNLLTEKLIGVRYENGTKEHLTLPGVLDRLSNTDIESFTALQPHQEQAWYCFLVQLAAMAMHECGTATIKGDEIEWTRRLRSLTKEYPGDEPWCMVVEDLSKPAFMQTPVPEGNLKSYKNAYTVPDEIDTLIVAKDHDVKAQRISKPGIENWLYALVNLQTMQGYLGRNYGIIRMNSGYSNRPFLAYAHSENFSSRYCRDTNVLVGKHAAVCEKYGYKKKGGAKLLWFLPWDGKSQCVLQEMDPYFIEICRLIRFEKRGSSTVCRKANTSVCRIVNNNVNGVTGDPWNVINTKDAKSFSLSSSGYTYKVIHGLLFEAVYSHPICLEFQNNETGDWLLLAKGLVRGEGITEGLHERKIPIPGKVRFFFDSEEGKATLSKISNQMINYVSDFTNKVFRMAVYTLMQPDKEKFDFKDERPQKWSKRLDHEIDRIYFERLWQFVEGNEEENRKLWLSELKKIGKTLLTEAFDSIPLPSVRKYKTISAAEGRFNGSFYNTFPFMKPQPTGGSHG